MTRNLQLWKGELPLQEAFWNWAVLGGLAVNLVTSLAFALLMVGDQLIPALLAGYGLSIPYNLLAAVGVWRSADKYQGEKQWADLARLTTIAGMILLSIT